MRGVGFDLNADGCEKNRERNAEAIRAGRYEVRNEDFLEQERSRAPPTVSFVLTRDVASIVEDRLTMLLRNGQQGLLLVFLVMWLFFSFRFSFWVTMGLPASFFGSLAVMTMLGLSITAPLVPLVTTGNPVAAASRQLFAKGS